MSDFCDLFFFFTKNGLGDGNICSLSQRSRKKRRKGEKASKYVDDEAGEDESDEEEETRYRFPSSARCRALIVSSTMLLWPRCSRRNHPMRYLEDVNHGKYHFQYFHIQCMLPSAATDIE